MNGWMDGWMNGWMNGQMDEWMDRRIDEWIVSDSNLRLSHYIILVLRSFLFFTFSAPLL